MRLFYEVQRHYEPPVAGKPATKIVRNSLPYDTEFPSTHSKCARRGCLSAEGARALHASLEREANASVTVPKVVWQACWNRCNNSAGNGAIIPPATTRCSPACIRRGLSTSSLSESGATRRTRSAGG